MTYYCTKTYYRIQHKFTKSGPHVRGESSLVIALRLIIKYNISVPSQVLMFL